MEHYYEQFSLEERCTVSQLSQAGKQSQIPAMAITITKINMLMVHASECLNSQTKCNTYWIRCCNGTLLRTVFA